MKTKAARGIAFAVSIVMLALLIFLFITARDAANLISKPSIQRAHRQRNLRNDSLARIGKAMISYMHQHNNYLPPMSDIRNLETALKSYDPDPFLFIANSDSGRLYKTNPYLSNRKFDSLKYPGDTAAVYSEDPVHVSLDIYVVFADGHYDYVNKNQWPRIKRVSKLP